MLDREDQRLSAVRSRPVLARPEVIVDVRANDVDSLRQRSDRVLGHRLDRADTELAHTLARLRALSPKSTLERGYAIVQRSDTGAVLREAVDVSAGDALRVRLSAGEIAAVVTDSLAAS
jgi:exodeoxyribonuclease VII large subunit